MKAVLFLASAAMTLAAAAPSYAQAPSPEASARAPAAWLAAGDAASYDFSFGASWTVREVDVVTRDPLNIAARLEVRGLADDKVEGRLDVRSVAYQGPGGRWKIDAHGPHSATRLDGVRQRIGKGSTVSDVEHIFGGADRTTGVYAGRLAAAEEALGVALAALVDRPFIAWREEGDGDVHVLAADGKPFAASGATDAAVKRFVGQAIRFVLPDDGARSESLAPGGDLFTLAPLLGATVAEGPAVSGPTPPAGDGRTDVRPLPAGDLDLVIAPASAKGKVKGRTTTDARSGLVGTRTLDLTEQLSGRNQNRIQVDLQSAMTWRAQLKAAKVKATSSPVMP